MTPWLNLHPQNDCPFLNSPEQLLPPLLATRQLIVTTIVYCIAVIRQTHPPVILITPIFPSIAVSGMGLTTEGSCFPFQNGWKRQNKMHCLVVYVVEVVTLTCRKQMWLFYISSHHYHVNTSNSHSVYLHCSLCGVNNGGEVATLRAHGLLVTVILQWGEISTTCRGVHVRAVLINIYR